MFHFGRQSVLSLLRQSRNRPSLISPTDSPFPNTDLQPGVRSMHKTFTRILGVALLVCCASVANANQYPPGPGRACPDPLRTINLQLISVCCTGF